MTAPAGGVGEGDMHDDEAPVKRPEHPEAEVLAKIDSMAYSEPDDIHTSDSASD